jgi:hypothetical protein
VFLLFSSLDGVVHKWTGQPIPWGLPIQVGLVVTLGLASDWQIRHTWFGAKKEELPEERLKYAELSATLFLIGSWVTFITTSIVVNSPD